jgi:cell division protein FtsQ
MMENDSRNPAFRGEESFATKFRRGFRRHRRGIGLLTALMILLIAAACVFAVPLESITVSGNRHYSEEEIKDRIFTGPFSRSALLTYMKYRFQDHVGIPFVSDYKLVYKDPTHVEVIVYEKNVIGYVSYMGSNMYFDKDGIVVESTSEVIGGVPLITGLHFGHIVLNQALPVDNSEVFSQILNQTQILATSGISPDKINYDKNLNSTLYIKNLKVVLGGQDSMSGKLMELKDILASYPDLNGTLYLDSYDESNSSPIYRFEKNS